MKFVTLCLLLRMASRWQQRLGRRGGPALALTARDTGFQTPGRLGVPSLFLLKQDPSRPHQSRTCCQLPPSVTIWPNMPPAWTQSASDEKVLTPLSRSHRDLSYRLNPFKNPNKLELSWYLNTTIHKPRFIVVTGTYQRIKKIFPTLAGKAIMQIRGKCITPTCAV